LCGSRVSQISVLQRVVHTQCPVVVAHGIGHNHASVISEGQTGHAWVGQRKCHSVQTIQWCYL